MKLLENIVNFLTDTKHNAKINRMYTDMRILEKWSVDVYEEKIHDLKKCDAPKKTIAKYRAKMDKYSQKVSVLQERIRETYNLIHSNNLKKEIIEDKPYLKNIIYDKKK